MWITLIETFLLSISPFGEARVGIVFGIARGLNPWLVFFVGTIANLLVYPLLKIFIAFLNSKLWNYRPYRRQAVKLSQRSKRLVGKHIIKYGFWGLMIFVMIPLPGTGAYMGTIAAIIFNLPSSKAFYSVSLGVFISCIIMALVSVLGVSFTTM